MGTSTTDELLKRLDSQHQAYLETFRLVHAALATTNRGLEASHPPPDSPALPLFGNSALARLRRPTIDTADTDPRSERSSSSLLSPIITKAATFQSSILTGDDSDSSNDDEDLYVQVPLSPKGWNREDLRHHLKTYKFNDEGYDLLETVVDENGRLKNPNPKNFFEAHKDEGVGSHYSIFDIAADGAPLSRHEVVEEGTKSIHDAIWQVIRDINADARKEKKAVGRITIIREPSPIIFGALHLTMNDYFDMDEIFSYLVHDSNKTTTRAYMGQDRCFHEDHRRQRTFVFSFEYFTVIGADCAPMPWQIADKGSSSSSPSHIPISRCSSIVALSLSGPPIRKLKNVSRRKKKTIYGQVHDPWGPWQVLNIQCYPDLKHSMDVHDSSKHYVNGPEAFLYTLLAEFRDCQKRFEEIYDRITKLITPPADFMFNSALRDKLLFEDAEFTYSRRYFWAFQTLGIMNNNIKSIIDSYTDTFTTQFWAGEHRSLWPLLEGTSARNIYWKKKMAILQKEFEREINKLKEISEENNERRKEIRTLRDQLFSGTSVLESRKSVEMASITIQQGHNIKLLTLVSIFFLPLTFVTSVFGMTNMPTERHFATFGTVMAVVCIPFFLLIGSLNTTQGMQFWIDKWHRLVSWITRTPLAMEDDDTNPNFDGEKIRMRKQQKFRRRSMSHLEALAARRSQLVRLSPASTLEVERENPQRVVMNAENEAGTSGHGKEVIQTSWDPTGKEAKVSFLQRWFGKKKKERDHAV